VSIEAQLAVTIGLVAGGVLALARAVVAFENQRRARGVLLVAVFVAALTTVLWLGFRPVPEPDDCVFVSPYWVDGVETTRCVPRGDR
jgi:hypothetical protein